MKKFAWQRNFSQVSMRIAAAAAAVAVITFLNDKGNKFSAQTAKSDL
jgi:hypothetical protein